MSIEERLFVVEEITHLNGDVTWVPVNIETATKETTYQVFNTFTGQHEHCETLMLAKEKHAELLARITVGLETATPQKFEPEGIVLLRIKLEEKNKAAHPHIVRLEQVIQK